MTDNDIRLATSQDLKALTDCMSAAYSIYKDRIPDLPDVTEGLASAIKTQSTWVIDVGQSLAGGIILRTGDHYLVIENIAVHPDSAGMGIGRKLIEFAHTQCKEHHLNEIRLSTHKDIGENIALYRHLGWKELNIKGNKVLMTKII